MNEVGGSSRAITRPNCPATAPSQVAAVITLVMTAACSRGGTQYEIGTDAVISWQPRGPVTAAVV
jgi:hypothetical protein